MTSIRQQESTSPQIVIKKNEKNRQKTITRHQIHWSVQKWIEHSLSPRCNIGRYLRMFISNLLTCSEIGISQSRRVLSSGYDFYNVHLLMSDSP